MSTNQEEVRIQEFAQQCLNSLRIVKDASPKNWKEILAPYKKEISDKAQVLGISESHAIDMILDSLSEEIKDDYKKLQASYTWYMAAYCTFV